MAQKTHNNRVPGEIRAPQLVSKAPNGFDFRMSVNPVFQTIPAMPEERAVRSKPENREYQRGVNRSCS
jgi:hypothetical protein